MRRILCFLLFINMVFICSCANKTSYIVYYDANSSLKIENPFMFDVRVTGKTIYTKEGTVDYIDIGKLLQNKITEVLKKNKLYLYSYELNVNKYMVVVNINFFEPGSAKERAQAVTTSDYMDTNNRLHISYEDIDYARGESLIDIDVYVCRIKKVNNEYIVMERIAKIPYGNSHSALDAEGSFEPFIEIFDIYTESQKGKGWKVIEMTANDIVKLLKNSFYTSK